MIFEKEKIYEYCDLHGTSLTFGILSDDVSRIGSSTI